MYIFSVHVASLEVKSEARAAQAPYGNLSPETAGLLASLPDTPNSLALKAEYLSKANELQRGEQCL